MMTAAVAGALLFAAAEAATGLVVARGLMGIGCAVGLMGALVLVGRWFSPERFAMLSALLFALGGCGTLLATAPLAAVTELIGWRGAFVGMAGVTALLALLVFIVVRDAPPSVATTFQRTESIRDIGLGIIRVLRHRELRYVAALQLVSYGSLMSVAGLWAGPYLEDVHGLGTVDRGRVLLAINLAVIIGALCYGWIAPRSRPPKRLVVAGTGLTASIFAAMAVLNAPSLPVAVTGLVLIGLLGSPVMLLHAHARAVLPAHLLGRGLTLQNAASIGGVFLWQSATGLIVDAFPPVQGVVSEAAYRAVFAFLGAVCLAGLLVYARSDPAPNPMPETN